MRKTLRTRQLLGRQRVDLVFAHFRTFFERVRRKKTRVFARTIRKRLRPPLSSGDATRASLGACRGCSRGFISASMCAACSCAIRRNSGAYSCSRAASSCRSRAWSASTLCFNCAKKSADSECTIHLRFCDRASHPSPSMGEELRHDPWRNACVATHTGASEGGGGGWCRREGVWNLCQRARFPMECGKAGKGSRHRPVQHAALL